MLSVFNTVGTPVFNPLIYSLRTKDVIAALKKLLLKKILQRCEHFLMFVSEGSQKYDLISLFLYSLIV